MNWLQEALWNSWSPETSAYEWVEENPQLGQCAVSSMVIQDYIGGRIRRGSVMHDGLVVDSHYWNFILAGTEFDTTTSQFDKQYGHHNWYLKDIYTVERSFLEENDDTMRRYRILSRKVSSYLGWKASLEERSLV